MSFASNERKLERKQVVTYKEIILIFIIFTLILIVLYPKDLLKKHILTENSNYDLSMLYLKNMLKNDPTNETLMLSLATQSLRSGRKDLAERLLALLHKSKDPQILYKAYRESYILEKENYFYFLAKKEIKQKKKYFNILTGLFNTINKKHYYADTEYKYMFKESMFLRQPERAFHFTLLRKENMSIKIAQMEQVYYLALKENSIAYSMRAVNFEMSHDKKHQKKWRNAKYYLLAKYYSRNEAVAYMKQKAKNTRFWRGKLAEYYFAHKEFKNSADIYMEEFRSSSNYKKRKFYFKKAINTLAAQRDKNAILRLAKQYEHYFFHDESMCIYLLKTYIANGKPAYAAALSKKILQRKY